MSLTESAWKFVSNSNFGVGNSAISASAGLLELREPKRQKEKEGDVIDFDYVGVGTGLGLPVGISIPIDTKLAGGGVFLLPQFDGEELSKNDIQGAFLMYEGSVSFIVGGAVTLMFVGGNAALVPLIVMAMTAPGGIGNFGVSQALMLKFYLSFTGVVGMVGVNAGYVAGLTGYFGYLN